MEMRAASHSGAGRDNRRGEERDRNAPAPAALPVSQTRRSPHVRRPALPCACPRQLVASGISVQSAFDTPAVGRIFETRVVSSVLRKK